MSEPRDRIDEAYAEAEAMLSDEAARAARRARVLAAVAQASVAPARPRVAWRVVGSLAAAGVVGVVVVLANQVEAPPPAPRPAAPAQLDAMPSAPPAPSLGAAEPDRRSVAPAPRAVAPRSSQAAPVPPPPLPLATAPSPAPPAIPAPTFDLPRARSLLPPPPPPPPPPPAPPAPAAARASNLGVEEIVVTGSRVERRAAAAAAASERLAERLRVAAGRGRQSEVERLLARGAPIDEADADGETALMKSVKARQPAVAALLRKHGASLDLKNQAGLTARDMAAALGDAALDRALAPE